MSRASMTVIVCIRILSNSGFEHKAGLMKFLSASSSESKGGSEELGLLGSPRERTEITRIDSVTMKKPARV